MELKAAVFDIDGTLVPPGAVTPGARTLRAIRALQETGVKIIIATGRARYGGMPLLGGLKPDYFVGVCGNCVTDAAGKVVLQNTMTQEEMYALVDFFEDHELPLGFIFSDAYYAYVEYERMCAAYGPLQNTVRYVRDGEDQVRHLENMPFGALGALSPEQAALFKAKYDHLKLDFLPFYGPLCDILQHTTGKRTAVQQLLARLGIAWEHTAAFGDGSNDRELLAAAGMAVAMQGAAEELTELADIVAPPCAEDGVGCAIETYLL